MMGPRSGSHHALSRPSPPNPPPPTMKPTQPSPEKNFTADQQVFDRLPAAIREMAIRKDRAEKATGPERVALDTTFPATLPARAPRPVQSGANA